jgi:hypothetical protein
LLAKIIMATNVLIPENFILAFFPDILKWTNRITMASGLGPYAEILIPNRGEWKK